MRHKGKTFGFGSAFLLLMLIVQGCATTRQLDVVREDVLRIERKVDILLGLPGPVTTETAASIAIRFANLEEVKNVAPSREPFTHSETVNVLGYDGLGDVLVGIDAATGEVVRMTKQCPYPGIDSEVVSLSGEEALASALAYMKEKDLRPIPEGMVAEPPQLETTWRKKHWRVSWRHTTEDGLAVANDFVTFWVNPETGTVDNFSKVFHNVAVALVAEIDEQEAVGRARSILGSGRLEAYSPQLSVLRVTRKVVYPNNFFERFTYEWVDQQALAWVVQFGDGSKPDLDVWVDARSGAILGGEIYERPVPELWGIPNQTGDIANIWQPALDMMQYDAGGAHTVLDDADEADVIDSIANGQYFVLQTHGGATTTAEGAVISHGGTYDETHLTPDEVPANNLRYALVSCCESAHDGPGEDFKDVFVDRGADVFQGYVESINPDPYEMRLVRYLAQGMSLWNAHENAKADVAPWFTIVIDYGNNVSCFNQVYLAPIRVAVSAPASTSHIATITATISNHEHARDTAATNLFARLAVPGGVWVTDGAVTQSTPVLAVHDSWTVQWKVRSWEWWSPNTTKTFDIEVWSDNLGVAVTDFDDPYHKFQITFTRNWFEPFRGWFEVLRRFPELPEPRNIIDWLRSLGDILTLDDLQARWPRFIEIMSKIAELELQFANHDRVIEAATEESLAAFRAAVTKKQRLLTELGSGEITDLEAQMESLARHQAAVDEAARAAFAPQDRAVAPRQ